MQEKAKQANQIGLTRGGEQSSVRKSNINWMNKNNDSKWVFEKLGHIVSRINRDYYNFDLTGFGEDIQLTNYSGSNFDRYGWHQDFGAKNVSRKLSVVLQLSDPKDYEGGNLQIMNSEKPNSIQRERGFLVAFPCWSLHQVTPVTKGDRQSLVAWITGPEFK